MLLLLPAFGKKFIFICPDQGLLLPGRAVSATSTVNQHKPEPITGHAEGDLDKRREAEKVERETRKDQKREIELKK